MGSAPWLKMRSKSLRVRTGLIQLSYRQHLMAPDRKYLLWSAAVGASYTLFVQVKTHVWSDDSAWKIKTSTEESPRSELPFTPDVSDKTTGSLISLYQRFCQPGC